MTLERLARGMTFDEPLAVTGLPRAGTAGIASALHERLVTAGP